VTIRTVRARTAVLGVCAVAATATAAGAYAAAGEPEATRTALAGVVDPGGAKGQTLGLSRVTVPPKAVLATHRHPGTQVAFIEKGTLTYTVRTGSVTVRRGSFEGDAKVVRRIRAGTTGRIRSGEWIVEHPGTIHSARNAGSQTIVIYLASLFENGEPAAIPVS